MKLFIATNNKHKLTEISRVLNEHNIGFEIPRIGDFPEVDENGVTLIENAKIKARAGFLYSGIPSIADDTGLEVDYLNGEPGVYSARYAGNDCSYDDNNKKLRMALENVPYEKRTARFRTVIALALGKDDFKTVEGSVEGYIIDAPRGNNGFGYDPIFYYPPLDKTFAELEIAEKNSISHRGQALIKLDKLLSTGFFKF
ncbi:MAG: RdgB/HAM1 family non-canonical purine NTP pyrophosphatase [candidate division Zixibacteria bacterium]|nr:RdgB/HAM1 family non-canonical purine NTP pyrophosphatase [candidate division Zixibacteria bacterium]